MDTPHLFFQEEGSRKRKNRSSVSLLGYSTSKTSSVARPNRQKTVYRVGGLKRTGCFTSKSINVNISQRPGLYSHGASEETSQTPPCLCVHKYSQRMLHLKHNTYAFSTYGTPSAQQCVRFHLFLVLSNQACPHRAHHPPPPPRAGPSTPPAHSKYYFQNNYRANQCAQARLESVDRWSAHDCCCSQHSSLLATTDGAAAT